MASLEEREKRKGKKKLRLLIGGKGDAFSLSRQPGKKKWVLFGSSCIFRGGGKTRGGKRAGSLPNGKEKRDAYHRDRAEGEEGGREKKRRSSS